MRTRTPETSASALLEAYLGGDDTAFSTLERGLRKPLEAIIRRSSLGLPADLREDIRQEVWLDVSTRRLAGKIVFDAREKTPVGFIASFVRNATQRVRAAHRPPGTRSRVRQINEPNTTQRSHWGHVGPETLDDLLGSEGPGASVQPMPTDLHLDLAAALSRAGGKVAGAISFVLEGDSLNEAARRAGLTPSTFSRRLAALARAA